MLGRPEIDFEPIAPLLARRLEAVLLAKHPAAGRSGRGRAATGSERPAIHEVARALVRRAGDGQAFSQGALAAWSGLSRPTVCYYIGVWMEAGLIDRVDDAGQPVERGTALPPGTAARYVLDRRWTAGLVDLMPEGWRPRLELAWRSLRADVPDKLIGSCLRRMPGANGDRVLRRHCRQKALEERSRQRAEEAAAERAGRCSRGTGGGLQARAGPGRKEFDTPLNETRSFGPSGLGPYVSGEAARYGKPERRPRTEPSAAQRRQAIKFGAADDTRVGVLWDDFCRSASLIGEADPVSVWGQLLRIVETGEIRDEGARWPVAPPGSLDFPDLVGECIRTFDELRCDVPAAVAAGKREPVRSGAAWCCGVLRKRLYAARVIGIPLRREAPTPAAAGPEPRYEPPPEPVRRLSDEECLSLRERAAALVGGRTISDAEEAPLVAKPRPEPVRRPERPPTPEQIEEARRTMAEGFPVPARYLPYLSMQEASR